MDNQQAWESLGQLEAKYNELLAQANANIALLKQLCAEKDATLEASDRLLETYRQHDELQKAEIARLREALETIKRLAAGASGNNSPRRMWEIHGEVIAALSSTEPTAKP